MGFFNWIMGIADDETEPCREELLDACKKSFYPLQDAFREAKAPMERDQAEDALRAVGSVLYRRK